MGPYRIHPNPSGLGTTGVNNRGRGCYESFMAVPKMRVDKSFFSSREEVMQDIAKTGFWPHTFVSGKSPELPLHYHEHDVIGYVIEGETYLLDEEEKKVPICAGDRLDFPKGSWHAEGEVTDRVVYIVTLKEPIPLLEGVMPMEPRGPFPSFD